MNISLTTRLCRVRTTRPEVAERQPAARAEGFTLIEMLAVIGIIVIMTGLVVLAFNHLGSANVLTTAGNQAADLLNFARQNSLSKNGMTALVLLTDVEPDRTRQAFGVLQLLPKTGASTYQPGDWTQITAWEEIANGACVDVSLDPSRDDACTFQDASAQDNSSPVRLPASFSFGGHTVSSYKFVIFLAAGNLLGGVSAHLEVIEGYLQPGPANTASPLAVYTHPVAGTSSPVLPANFYRVTVLASTGRTKIDRFRNSSSS